ncbi:MAG: MerR family transcriptional regulator [Lachnospiraceae bacterium]|nr:MerR family transcriptional regulator [Lachnospiraceae bacterium]
MKKETRYSVGTMAALCKCSVATLQRYDIQNLLPAHRTETGRRYYLESDIELYKNVKKNHVMLESYSVKQFADKLKLSVRYLQKIDNLGYFKAARTESGYRYYPYNSVYRYLHNCKLNEVNVNRVQDIIDFYSVAEVSKILDIPERTLRDWNLSGYYSANIRPGSAKHYFYTDLDIDYLSRIV